jgi:hypothetical protein
MQKQAKTIVILIVTMAVFCTGTAHAQWVFVARKALGKIEQMRQAESKGSPRYDVATVVIEGTADKVYGTAIKTIQAKDKLRITRQDPAQRIIDFTDGTQSAGLMISQVNDTVVHLLIASVILPEKPSETSLVLSGVLRVCEAMGAICTVEK